MDTVALVAALILAGTFAVLSILHLVWAVRPSGPSPVVIPTVDGKAQLHPGPLATLAVAAALACAAAVSLWRVGVIPRGWPTIPRVGMWVLAAVFLARAVGDLHLVGLFKRVRDTPFARYDSWLYSPLCLLVATLAVVVATLAPP